MSREFLFVYGTLRRELGVPMRSLLDECASFLGTATVRGKLLDVGLYPALIRSDDPDDRVTGELYALDNPEHAFGVLDPYERCGPNDPPPTEYVRATVRATPEGDEPVEAWTYLYNLDPSELEVIPSGDYAAYVSSHPPERAKDAAAARPAITAPAIGAYLDDLLPERDALLMRLERDAEAGDVPIIGPHGGQLLHTIAKLARPQRMLEVGTAIGYSAIWLARATAHWGAAITSIELDALTAENARRNLKSAGVLDRVDVRVGDALEVVRALEGPFDFVFLDADKRQYQALVELVLPLMPPGAALVVDNLLWGGRVLDDNPDETTEAIQAFNRYLGAHPELETLFLPLRDGIALSLRR